jgi:hypothetical protein
MTMVPFSDWGTKRFRAVQHSESFHELIHLIQWMAPLVMAFALCFSIALILFWLIGEWYSSPVQLLGSNTVQGLAPPLNWL